MRSAKRVQTANWDVDDCDWDKFQEGLNAPSNNDIAIFTEEPTDRIKPSLLNRVTPDVKTWKKKPQGATTRSKLGQTPFEPEPLADDHLPEATVEEFHGELHLDPESNPVPSPAPAHGDPAHDVSFFSLAVSQHFDMDAKSDRSEKEVCEAEFCGDDFLSCSPDDTQSQLDLSHNSLRFCMPSESSMYDHDHDHPHEPAPGTVFQPIPSPFASQRLTSTHLQAKRRQDEALQHGSTAAPTATTATAAAAAAAVAASPRPIGYTVPQIKPPTAEQTRVSISAHKPFVPPAQPAHNPLVPTVTVPPVHKTRPFQRQPVQSQAQTQTNSHPPLSQSRLQTGATGRTPQKPANPAHFSHPAGQTPQKAQVQHHTVSAAGTALPPRARTPARPTPPTPAPSAFRQKPVTPSPGMVRQQPNHSAMAASGPSGQHRHAQQHHTPSRGQTGSHSSIRHGGATPSRHLGTAQQYQQQHQQHQTGQGNGVVQPIINNNSNNASNNNNNNSIFNRTLLHKTPAITSTTPTASDPAPTPALPTKPTTTTNTNSTATMTTSRTKPAAGSIFNRLPLTTAAPKPQTTATTATHPAPTKIAPAKRQPLSERIAAANQGQGQGSRANPRLRTRASLPPPRPLAQPRSQPGPTATSASLSTSQQKLSKPTQKPATQKPTQKTTQTAPKPVQKPSQTPSIFHRQSLRIKSSSRAPTTAPTTNPRPAAPAFKTKPPSSSSSRLPRAGLASSTAPRTARVAKPTSGSAAPGSSSSSRRAAGFTPTSTSTSSVFTKPSSSSRTKPTTSPPAPAPTTATAAKPPAPLTPGRAVKPSVRSVPPTAVKSAAPASAFGPTKTPARVGTGGGPWGGRARATPYANAGRPNENADPLGQNANDMQLQRISA